MVIISVLYPKHSGSKFAHDYYVHTHTPMVKVRWSSLGLTNVELLRGVSALDGGPCPYEMTCLLTFTSVEVVQAAMAAFGSEIVADIANFTNTQPVIQINQPVT
jgi:uncharacterized protein (TIGR02118 family)